MPIPDVCILSLIQPDNSFLQSKMMSIHSNFTTFYKHTLAVGYHDPCVVCLLVSLSLFCFIYLLIYVLNVDL